MSKDKLYPGASLVPLGGMGAGYLQLDGLGRLHDYLRYPAAPGRLLTPGFAALRMEDKDGQVHARILCCNDDGCLRAVGNEMPPFLTGAEYKRQTQYPATNFTLKENVFPCNALWTYFAPLAPYDPQASVLPAVILGVRVSNTTDAPLRCSVMFALENMARPADDGIACMHLVRVEPARENSNFDGKMFRGTVAEASSEAVRAYPYNAILFGERRYSEPAQAAPHFCLAAKEHLDAATAVSAWNEDDAEASARAWGSFVAEGRLPFVGRAAPDATVGATCMSISLAPGATHRFDFILSWHMPAAYAQRLGLNTGYLQHYASAADTVEHAYKHVSYFFGAITNWQKHLTAYDLPRTLARSIINSTRALTTLTHQTADGRFMLLTEPNGAVMPACVWPFFSTLAVLIFAPRFHAAAITSTLECCLREHPEEGREQALVRRAGLVLSVFADVFYTGNRARLAEWFPQLFKLLFPTGGENWSHAALHVQDARQLEALGWVCVAMRALTFLARYRNEEEAVLQCEQTNAAVRAAYEREMDARCTQAGAGTCPLSVFSGVLAASLLNLDLGLPPAKAASWWKALQPGSAVQGLAEPEQMQLMLGRALFKRDAAADAREWFQQLLHGVSLEASSSASDAAGPAMLGLWPLLTAIGGLHYNALDSVLIVRLSELHLVGVRLPVFTPVCFGKIVVQPEPGQDRVLHVRISLDSPTAISAITFLLPHPLAGAKVSCIHDGETLPVRCKAHAYGQEGRVVIVFGTPLKLRSELAIRLREIQA